MAHNSRWKCTDEEFARAWVQFAGHVSSVATAFGMGERHAYERRLKVEKRLGIVLPSGKDITNRSQVKLPKRGYRHIIKTGGPSMIVVFGDAHNWPNEPVSTSFDALLEVIKEYKPKYVIDNGDMFDGARISRHPPVGWVDLPDVADELAVCQERKGEIAAVARKANPDVELRHNMGNHDTRFSSRLAMMAPDYVRVHGTDLKDHFPDWSFAWSTEVNGHVMIKHRWHNGLHGVWNNVLKSGWSFISNHDHRGIITPITDYNGRRWGVSTGMLSEFGPEHDKQTWTEDNPLNWGEGFAVIQLDEWGKIVPPELCEVIDKRAWFRGQVIVDRSTKKKRKAA